MIYPLGYFAAQQVKVLAVSTNSIRRQQERLMPSSCPLTYIHAVANENAHVHIHKYNN